MTQLLAPQPIGAVRHTPPEEYYAFLRRHYANLETEYFHRSCYAQFLQAYPDLQMWFEAPLAERVGRLYGTGPREWCNRVSYRARPYLYFLVSRGYATLDWDWLIAVPTIHLEPLLQETGLAQGVQQLIDEGVHLGYSPRSSHQRMNWVITHLLLHEGFLPFEALNDRHWQALTEAVKRFGMRPDVSSFFGSPERYRKAQAAWTAVLYKFHVILYHRGQSETEPRVITPLYAHRPTLKPRMEAVAKRYIAARQLTDRPGTIQGLELALRRFIGWLAETHPHVESWASVTRDHLLEYANFLGHCATTRGGKPLATNTKRGRLSKLSRFFSDTAAWGWEETPGRSLLSVGDLPKLPERVPRYIPEEEELARLMQAVHQLSCPYQRAALLVARWSGARRGEIRRLALNCLDRYPDGTARLHLPVGKTKRERLVPLHEEAASAIRELQALHRGQRGLSDEQTGVETQYLFMRIGKLYSTAYLFESALQQACEKAGLTNKQGKPTITAHRFRHTVGTQLAEKGARLHTIMKVLGHTSASMSMVYAQISDKEVLKDYQAVLGPGAIVAGPSAEVLRSGELAASAVDWLKSNWLKTELELGRCLRLPQEGPCECDLYLTCAKFVTSPAYAPRLRRRHRIEQELGEDARQHGWQREVERHHCTMKRMEQLLADLGEPLDGPEAPE